MLREGVDIEGKIIGRSGATPVTHTVGSLAHCLLLRHTCAPRTMASSDQAFPGRRFALLLFGILLTAFVIVSFGNALHKGGDFTVSLEAGHRFLTAAPLYEGSSPGDGVTGPPFQSVWFAPFAAIASFHTGLSRILWYIVNVACLLAGIWCWTHAILPGRFSSARDLWSSPEVLLPFLAIALPAQTNFEHQNMNALLLFLTGAGALAVVRRADTTAGALLGAAVALKAFPLLLLGSLVVRRKWRVVIVGGVFAFLLTSMVAVRYGATGGLQTFRDWLAISVHGGWPIRAQNQSLFAAFSRSWPGDVSLAHSIAWCVLVALLVVVLWKRRSLPISDAGSEITLALATAVILSPIAWEHYWVLIFPILQTLYIAGTKPVFQRAAFWLAAVLITGPSPLLVGESGYNRARELSNSIVATILLIGALTPSLLRKSSRRFGL
jgi:alpha-1,2-mannosyltransferase